MRAWSFLFMMSVVYARQRGDHAAPAEEVTTPEDANNQTEGIPAATKPLLASPVVPLQPLMPMQMSTGAMAALFQSQVALLNSMMVQPPQAMPAPLPAQPVDIAAVSPPPQDAATQAEAQAAAAPVPASNSVPAGGVEPTPDEAEQVNAEDEDQSWGDWAADGRVPHLKVPKKLLHSMFDVEEALQKSSLNMCETKGSARTQWAQPSSGRWSSTRRARGRYCWLWSMWCSCRSCCEWAEWCSRQPRSSTSSAGRAADNSSYIAACSSTFTDDQALACIICHQSICASRRCWTGGAATAQGRRAFAKAASRDAFHALPPVHWHGIDAMAPTTTKAKQGSSMEPENHLRGRNLPGEPAGHRERRRRAVAMRCELVRTPVTAAWSPSLLALQVQWQHFDFELPELHGLPETYFCVLVSDAEIEACDYNLAVSPCLACVALGWIVEIAHRMRYECSSTSFPGFCQVGNVGAWTESTCSLACVCGGWVSDDVVSVPWHRLAPCSGMCPMSAPWRALCAGLDDIGVSLPWSTCLLLSYLSSLFCFISTCGQAEFPLAVFVDPAHFCVWPIGP